MNAPDRFEQSNRASSGRWRYLLLGAGVIAVALVLVTTLQSVWPSAQSEDTGDAESYGPFTIRPYGNMQGTATPPTLSNEPTSGGRDAVVWLPVDSQTIASPLYLESLPAVAGFGEPEVAVSHLRDGAPTQVTWVFPGQQSFTIVVVRRYSEFPVLVDAPAPDSWAEMELTRYGEHFATQLVGKPGRGGPQQVLIADTTAGVLTTVVADVADVSALEDLLNEIAIGR